MLMLWWLAGAAAVVSLAALWTARRASRRVDALTQSYWEMRYEFTTLRSQAADAPAAPPRLNQGGNAPGAPQTSFVSLSSLKSGDIGKAGKAGNEGE
jgi:hypothetical protein